MEEGTSAENGLIANSCSESLLSPTCLEVEGHNRQSFPISTLLTFPLRTIPFRSASFSQVDVTPDGKYVRNSSILLKPTAFCLNIKSTTELSSPTPTPIEDVAISSSSGQFPVIAHAHSRSCPEEFNPFIYTPQSINFYPEETVTFTLGGDDEPISASNLIFNVSDTSNEPSEENIQDSTFDLEPNQNTYPSNLPIEMSSPISDPWCPEGATNKFPSIPIFDQFWPEDATQSSENIQESIFDQFSPKDTIHLQPNLSVSNFDQFGLNDSAPSPPNASVSTFNKLFLGDPTQSPPHLSISTFDEFCSENAANSVSRFGEFCQEDGIQSPSDAVVTSDVPFIKEKILPLESYPIASTFSPICLEESTLSRPLESSDIERNAQLIRQSSAQSDSTSDDPPVPITSDTSCSSPPPPTVGRGSLSSTLKLGSSAESSSSESGKISCSEANSRTVAEKVVDFDERRDGIGRTLSTSSGGSANGAASTLSSSSGGRFYKKPLRGPYGEMLEAEMNKLIPRRQQDMLGCNDAGMLRDSKSTSPIPGGSEGSSKGYWIKGGAGTTEGSCSRLIGSLTSMGSMDNLNRKKHGFSSFINSRSRKVPISSNQGGGNSCSSLGSHQRTSSYPLELGYVGPLSKTPPVSPPQTASLLLQLGRSPRGHVLAELVETERSYVDALTTMIKKYKEPLQCLMEPDLVEAVFCQIPLLLWHHSRFLDSLQKRVVDDQQSVGDVILDTFRPSSLLDSYALFVRNWQVAKSTLKVAINSDPSLARFLETTARQHRGRLHLDALLIMPIQRIPRYELLIKELLKFTDPTHEDHSRLILALEKVRNFALSIDCASVDPNETRELEIEGMGVRGIGPMIRQDLVNISLSTVSGGNRKERAIFLFPDCLLVASVKRKTGRKGTYNHASGIGNWEGCKLKYLFKANLVDVKVNPEEMERSGEVEEDVRTIHRMIDMATSLKCSHPHLDEVLKELLATLKTPSGDETQVQIQYRAGDSDTFESMRLFFGTVKKKNSWLETFGDAVSKHLRYGMGKASHVQFVQALPIRKTRAGLQLSCATPISPQNKASDIWVANSDGYVGQICILNLHPDPPSITSCNGVCNSRITCMTAVPPRDQAHLLRAAHASSEPPFVAEGGVHAEEHDLQKGKPGYKERWSVWLGTEDGGLLVYDCADSIRVKKNRQKIQHRAPLNCITYFEERVFVALGNGDVVVYIRNPSGKNWATGEPSWVTIGTAMAPVTKMLCVGRDVWCSCGSSLKIYTQNSGMLELVQSIQVNSDESGAKIVTAVVATEGWVWVALQSSSVIIAYSSETFERVHELNACPNVTKILGGCEEIIRQHKTACLRITSLCVAPQKTLWIGTSAGVLLTLSPANSPEARLTPLVQGHTGQVRFLTASLNRDVVTVISGGDGFEEFHPRGQCSSGMTSSIGSMSFPSIVTNLIGDGGGDPSGREDSTNHLLIWKVSKFPLQKPRFESM